MSEFTILVVCSANVCRSPSAAAVLSHRLTGPAYAGLQISDAGVAATAGQRWCSEAAAYLRRRSLVADDALEHRARQVTVDDLTQAGLVLAADREVLGTLIRTDPSARGRLFTVSEVAALGPAIAAERPAYIAAAAGDLPGQLRWWAAEMDSARGLMDLSETTARLLPWSRRPGEGGYDLPDAHVRMDGVSHRRMLPRLVQAAEDISAAVKSLC